MAGRPDRVRNFRKALRKALKGSERVRLSIMRISKRNAYRGRDADEDSDKNQVPFTAQRALGGNIKKTI